jgi:hypothetical protein
VPVGTTQPFAFRSFAMDILSLIWSFLLGLVPGGRQPVLARSARRLPASDANAVYLGSVDSRSAYGWMTAAPVHPLCARPPCIRHGGDGPAGRLSAVDRQLRT